MPAHFNLNEECQNDNKIMKQINNLSHYQDGNDCSDAEGCKGIFIELK